MKQKYQLTGDICGGVIGPQGVDTHNCESFDDDQTSTGEGVGDKCSGGHECKTRQLRDTV